VAASRQAYESVNRVVEIRPPGRRVEKKRPVRRYRAPKSNLKYPWQHPVLEAILEHDPDLALGKINVAERAISSRLCSRDPLDVQEHIALRGGLRGLRRWLEIQRSARRSKSKCTETAKIISIA